MRIAITGKMCSGKTYISEKLMNNYNLQKYAFGDKVKELAIEMFDMDYKNRKLIQNLAEKMKEIDNNVWVKHIINEIGNRDNIIIDDLRFPNELEYLRKHNFIIIRIDVDKDTQLMRLSEKYLDKFESHVERMEHISEKHIEKLPVDISFNSDNQTYSKIIEFIDSLKV